MARKARPTTAQGKPEAEKTVSEPAKTPEAEEARRWLSEIKWAEKGPNKDWQDRGDKIIQRYLDERGEYSERDLAKPQRRFNILWSNVETLSPAILSRTPVPNVSLANKDKDPVGRWAAIALERCLAAELRDDDYMASLQEAVRDVLLPGRGVVWVEYGADVDEGDGPDDAATPAQDNAEASEGESKEVAEAQVTDQDAEVNYVHWKDFLTNRARNWKEVTWVSKRVFLDRDTLVAKYGKIGKLVTLDHKPDELKEDPVTQQQFSKATVYQVWDSKSRKIIEVAPGYKDSLLREPYDPPVKFADFFPCPRPLYATLGGKSLIPTPDYVQYQDQAEEIDQLTNRIYGLSKALRLRGVYDQSFSGLAQIFNDGNDNELIPVESFALFTEKGGMKGAMEWVPIKEVIEALLGAYKARDEAKQALYEITGMSDIIRGATDASETATAQQIKTQWGSLRIRDRQADVQRFARDIINLQADVICEHYTQETIQQMSSVKLLTMQQKTQVQQWTALNQQRAQQAQQFTQQMQQMQQPGGPPQLPPQLQPLPAPLPQPLMEVVDEPTWDEVMALLRDPKLRNFVIDVETDSTIEPDQNAEREQATALLTGVTQYVAEWAKVLPMAPQLAPLCAELLTFAARKWKIGEAIETKIEEAGKLIEEGPPARPPDPMVQIEQQKADTEKHRSAAEVEREGLKTQVEQKKAEAENVRSEAVAQAARDKAAAESERAREETAIKRDELRHKSDQLDHERQKHADTMRLEHRKIDESAAQKREESAAAAQPKSEHAGTPAADPNEGLKALGEGIRDGMTAVAKAHMAPRKLVRGPDGKAAGIE